MNRVALIALLLLLIVLASVWLLEKNKTATPLPVAEESETQGVFKGYYEAEVKPGIASDGIPSQTCNTFVVEEGHSELVAYFKDMVVSGNTVQTLNQNGQLRINLPWNEISDSDRAVILASSPNEPATIELRKKIQEGKGTADRCHSFFSFVGVI